MIKAYNNNSDLVLELNIFDNNLHDLVFQTVIDLVEREEIHKITYGVHYIEQTDEYAFIVDGVECSDADYDEVIDGLWHI